MKLTFTLIALWFSVLLHAQKAGTLDSSFGINGIVTTDFNNNVDEANAVVLLPNKKILAAGTAYTNHQNFSLAQYNEDGSLDKSFGKNGKVLSYFGKLADYTYC